MLPASSALKWMRFSMVFIIYTLASGCASYASPNDAACSSASEDSTRVTTHCDNAPDSAALDTESRIKIGLEKIKGYKRDEGQTYLTLPEWYLVYSPAEYAQYLKEKKPSGFPYFGSIGQFWGYYKDVKGVTRGKYPYNGGYHTMILVIGASFTLENTVKGVYENTVGRVTEWTSSDAMTDEDRFAARAAQSYVDLIRVQPWYEYSFSKQIAGLWTDTSFFGQNMIRKVERKFALSVGYSISAVYATLIKLATKLAYGDADTEIMALVSDLSPGVLATVPKVNIKDKYQVPYVLVSLPRYEEFRDVVLDMVKKGVRFSEISGNKEILVTCLVPAHWNYDLTSGKMLFERPILTDPSQKRIAIAAPVQTLHEILVSLMDMNVTIEHIYDY